MHHKRKLDPSLQSMLLGLAQAKPGDVAMHNEDMRQEEPTLKIQALQESYRRIQSTDLAQFRPGDLVQWQPRMKHCKFPEYGQVAVVVECLQPPRWDDEPDSGSPYFRTPLTLVLGLQHQGGFHCWHFDGRRFERAI